MKSALSWINKIRARQLSRKGNHAAALAVCDMQDIEVLYRAGMYLSVLKKSKKTSIERAFSLAKVREVGQSLQMVKSVADSNKAKVLLGYLAVLAPDKIIQIIQDKPGLENIKAYCYCHMNEAHKIDNSKKLTHFHLISMALANRDVLSAKFYFEDLFRFHHLATPTVTWHETGLSYKTLACDAVKAASVTGPLISVILTAFNEEKYLAIAVQSLMSQSWQNLEIIVVNDASTDNTLDVIEELAVQDSRIKIINLKRNVGLWAAKNEGLKHCSGKFITMHDADDWSHPKKLEKQVEPLLSNKILATTSYMVRIDEKTGEAFTRNACNYLRWNPSSFMFKPELIEHHGGFVDNLLGSDCEFIARFETIYGVKMHKRIRQPLSIGLQRHGSLSNRFRDIKNAKTRITHWESWRKKHAQSFNNRSRSDLDEVKVQ